jgi:hypothetical protein
VQGVKISYQQNGFIDKTNFSIDYLSQAVEFRSWLVNNVLQMWLARLFLVCLSLLKINGQTLTTTGDDFLTDFNDDYPDEDHEEVELAENVEAFTITNRAALPSPVLNVSRAAIPTVDHIAPSDCSAYLVCIYTSKRLLLILSNGADKETKHINRCASANLFNRYTKIDTS